MDIIKIALYNYHKYRYLPHIILTQHWMNGDCKKINCNHINVEVNSVDRYKYKTKLEKCSKAKYNNSFYVH